jgi:hypothetical protein
VDEEQVGDLYFMYGSKRICLLLVKPFIQNGLTSEHTFAVLRLSRTGIFYLAKVC